MCDDRWQAPPACQYCNHQSLLKLTAALQQARLNTGAEKVLYLFPLLQATVFICIPSTPFLNQLSWYMTLSIDTSTSYPTDINMRRIQCVSVNPSIQQKEQSEPKKGPSHPAEKTKQKVYS